MSDYTELLDDLRSFEEGQLTLDGIAVIQQAADAISALVKKVDALKARRPTLTDEQVDKITVEYWGLDPAADYLIAMHRQYARRIEAVLLKCA